MPTAPLLKLPTMTNTSVFRAIVNVLKCDPDLKSVGVTWRLWEGVPADIEVPSIDQCPWIRLTPRTGPEDFWTPSELKGTLRIDAEIWVAGTCMDDLTNLWGAAQRALSPLDATRRDAIVMMLQSPTVGGWVGACRFVNASMTAAGDDGHLEGSASILIDYRFSQNLTPPDYTKS